ncbi:MAG: hypothetical protein HQ541_15040 [Mariniphaga sp.]|nr:hypothetical protein [Mariniphaga sp.]
MKQKNFYILFLFVISVSCGYDFPENDISSQYNFGEINTEKFVSIGDDFSAGVMNGALYTEGQQSSIPALIARQIAEVNEISFIQPNIDAGNGYNYYRSNSSEIFGKWIYQFSDKTSAEAQIVLTTGESITTYAGDVSNLNNLSIPFLKLSHISNNGLSANPYYERITKNPGQSTLANDIISSNPTFFYAWLGMNDILNYAINGAVSQEGDIFSEIKYTSVVEFEDNFDNLIDNLLQNQDCKGVIGNIISINDLPFFYTKPFNFLKLENGQISAAKSAIQLNKFNNGVSLHNPTAPDEDKRPFIGFEDNGLYNLYPQRLIIIDESLSDAYYPDGTPIPKYRQLIEGEIALFSITDEMVESGYGYKIPLSDKYVLTLNEIEEIQSVISSYNNIINRKVQQYPDKLVLADIGKEVHKIAITGTYDAWGQVQDNTIYYSNGIPIEGALGLNSVFSLDALHFNNRGNAFIANVFINAVNDKFSAFIPEADINDFPGNVYTVRF